MENTTLSRVFTLLGCSQKWKKVLYPSQKLSLIHKKVQKKSGFIWRGNWGDLNLQTMISDIRLILNNFVSAKLETHR